MKAFWAQYGNKIIGTVLTLLIAGAVTFMTDLHNAWGDDRYLKKQEYDREELIDDIEDLREKIRLIDNALFEIDQEIALAEGPQKAKWITRRNFYERQKAAFMERLQAMR